MTGNGNLRMPLVSVIMPAFNTEKYIAESIQSVIDQTYFNWELVIVNDGSIDATEDIVKKFSLSESRIKYIYQENQGQYTARNIAIKNASGSLIAFLDSDDIWASEKLQISVDEFLKDKQDLLFTDAYEFYETSDLENLDSLKYYGIKSLSYNGEKSVAIFLEQNRIPILTVLVKKDVILHLGGFPSIRIGEDYYLWLKLLLEGYSCRSIDKVLSFYRLRKDSLMSETKNESKEILDMFITLSMDYSVIRTNYKRQIKHWIRQFIKYRLNKENKNDLKVYFYYFNQFTLFTRLAFTLGKILPLEVYRKILKTVL